MICHEKLTIRQGKKRQNQHTEGKKQREGLIKERETNEKATLVTKTQENLETR